MAGNTFEERLTRLEEQFEALQALTQGLAAWEMGAARTPEIEKAPAPGRADERDSVFVGVDGGANHDDGNWREGGEPRASR
jgi:hypothetical protein